MNVPADKPSIKFERQLNVSPELVFDTLTKPELMIVWWGANVEFEIDLCVGGRWTIIRRTKDAQYLATGIYVDVERPRNLKYTYTMPQFSSNSDTIAIQIEPNDTGCSVIFEQMGEDIANELDELKKGVVSKSEAGWQQGFDLMQAAWSKPD